MYELGGYYKANDLTEQGIEIRDLLLTYPDFDTLKSKIEGIKTLEEESIIILKKAILAGYWTSYYGFSQTKEQEIEFWELVENKAPKSGVAILTLAESYRGNKIKTLKEVFDMYVDAIHINNEHLYSLYEDFEEIRKDPDLKYAFTDLQLNVLKKSWTKEEFEEELASVKKQCDGDIELEEYKTRKIKEIINEKSC